MITYAPCRIFDFFLSIGLIHIHLPVSLPVDARVDLIAAKMTNNAGRLYTTLGTRHSALGTRHSTLDNRQSTIDTRHSTLDTRHSTLDTRQHSTLLRSRARSLITPMTFFGIPSLTS